MGKDVSIIAKTPEEHGLSLETLIAALRVIPHVAPDSDSLTVIVVGRDTSYTINEVSIDGNFVRLFFNHNAPAVHPDN